MKVIALAAAAGSLLVTAALGTTASANSRSPIASSARLSMRVAIPTLHGLRIERAVMPLQAAATATATSTSAPTTGPTSAATTGPTSTPTTGPTSAPTPSPTSGGTNYPDPVTILQTAVTKFSAITNIHFEDLINGEQTNIEKLVIDAKGVANCSQAQQTTVTANDSVPGTSQSKKEHFIFIQKNKKYWKRQLVNDKTHKTWRTAKAKDVAPFGFTIDNPLGCTPASTGGSGSGGGSDTLRDVVNLGPVTYRGTAVWHIEATDVSTDAQGNTSTALLDYYVSRDQFLPYGYKVTVNDPDQNLTLSLEQVLTQFGKKVKVATPKVGATKP